MPTFMDFHDDLKLPDEAVRQITKETEEHKVDKFGVRQVELFHNPDGKVYCLLEAPDADSGPCSPCSFGPVVRGRPRGEISAVARLSKAAAVLREFNGVSS